MVFLNKTILKLKQYPCVSEFYADKTRYSFCIDKKLDNYEFCNDYFISKKAR